MFGIGVPELLLILAIALIVIGPKKLPDLAKSLGRAMREFKHATNDFKESMELDGDLKDVKSAFDEVKKDIRDPLNLNSAGETTDDRTDAKRNDLEKSYDQWKKDPAVDTAEKPPIKPAGDPSADAENKQHESDTHQSETQGTQKNG